MKSSYELAMERLNKQNPKVTPPTEDQKKQIAEMDSRYKAKIAEKELFLKPQIEEARMKGDFEATESLEKQLRDQTKILREEMEQEKEKIRKKT